MVIFIPHIKIKFFFLKNIILFNYLLSVYLFNLKIKKTHIISVCKKILIFPFAVFKNEKWTLWCSSFECNCTTQICKLQKNQFKLNCKKGMIYHSSTYKSYLKLKFIYKSKRPLCKNIKINQSDLLGLCNAKLIQIAL